MELGTHALIHAPSLWALTILLLYLVMIFRGYRLLPSCVAACILGAVLCGLSPAVVAKMISKGLGSFLGLIGLIIMLGSGLGEVMSRTGVSQSIVVWITNKIGVNSEKKGIVALIICSTVICGLLGTLAGGNAVIAPIIIPIVAAVGITPSTVGAVFQSAGETGLIWGPLTPPVVALMSVTGLSYWQMMKWAALPFGIIWLVVIFFAALKIQKMTKSWDSYKGIDADDVKAFIPTDMQKRTTLVFLLVFIASIVYALATKQKTTFVPVIMIFVALVTGLVGRMHMNDIFKGMASGMGRMSELFLAFIFLDVFINMIQLGGGFKALSVVLLKMLKYGGRPMLLMVGSFVGAFGVDGAAVAQIQITHELFYPAVKAMGLPMEMWAIGLIAASRITTSVYPTGNMVSQMGIAESDNLKAMLIGGWSVSIAALVYIMFWAFIGEKLFF